jgi:hypothetical protein
MKNLGLGHICEEMPGGMGGRGRGRTCQYVGQLLAYSQAYCLLHTAAPWRAFRAVQLLLLR